MKTSPSKAKSAQVEFPTVGQSGCAFIPLTVIRHEETDNQDTFAIAPGLERVSALLWDVRAMEASRASARGVIVRVPPVKMAGESYGLALAIADKRVHFGAALETRTIATGKILPGGKGRVVAIGDFDAKAMAVAEAAVIEDIVFAFPGENWKAASPETRQAVERVAGTGRLRLLPVDHVEDARALWKAPSSRTLGLREILSVVVVALVVAAGGAFFGAKWWAVDRCRAAVAALSLDSKGDPVSAAVYRCVAAVDRNSNSGRAHFLLGQAYALNGTPHAADEWRKAAELQDLDGKAAYGRELWLGGDVEGAKRWLREAAQAGSVVAMEDLATLLRERGQAADRAEGDLWRRRASVKTIGKNDGTRVRDE